MSYFMQEAQRLGVDTEPPTEDERARMYAARDHVHATTCPMGHQPGPCRACPTGAGLLLALRLLAERPKDAKGARWALHAATCASECGPDSDHADRTQAKVAASLRKFLTAA